MNETVLCSSNHEMGLGFVWRKLEWNCLGHIQEAGVGDWKWQGRKGRDKGMNE